MCTITLDEHYASPAFMEARDRCLYLCLLRMPVTMTGCPTILNETISPCVVTAISYIYAGSKPP